MQKRTTYWLMGCLAIILLASGCFQPAGTNPQSLSVADNNATFTPPPTDLPPPTLEPEFFVVTATLDPFSSQSVEVPTQSFGIAQVPTESFVQQPLDEMQMTATFIVQQATDIAALQLTGTACALGACLPTPTETPIFVATAAPIPGSDCIHEVLAGDNLYRISLKYGVTIDAIAAASNPQVLNPNILSIGQRLTIPGCGTTGAIPAATSTPEGGTGGIFVPTATLFTSTGGTGAVAGTTYIVKQNDTLFSISQQTGVLVQSIADANGIQNINMILIGQTLTIPNQ